VTAVTRQAVAEVLRAWYPDAAITVRVLADEGAYVAAMPARPGSYLGRDLTYTAMMLSWRLQAEVTVAPRMPPLGRGRAGLVITPAGRPAYRNPDRNPVSYTTPAQVLHGFKANRPATGLIAAAIRSRLHPHICLWPSEHGRRYKVILDSRLRDGLFGSFDVTEDGGRFAAAWITMGNDAAEQHTADIKEARRQIGHGRPAITLRAVRP
jgi:hypothetical protein